MNYISNALEPYNLISSYFFYTLITTLFLTPLIGSIAQKIKAVDLPSNLRKATERGFHTRIHKQAIPRLGGLAVIIPALILISLTIEPTTKFIGIIFGILLLTIGGILDDRFELDPKVQLLFQIMAGFVVVVTGTGINFINTPLNNVIDMRMLVIPMFQLGEQMLSFALPSDLFVIIWIILIINALKWAFGSDGVGEGITGIALLTLVFIGIKYNSPATSIIAISFLGGILGFFPFNFYPAKIYSGSTGQYVFGFLIAVLAIFGGAKATTSVIVLLFPILDMLWVMLGRVWREHIINPLKIMQISDTTHLHHRLKKMGFSTIQVALIEYSLVGISAVMGFYVGDFPKVFLLALIILLILIVLLLTSIFLNKGYQVKQKEKDTKTKNINESKKIEKEESPESKYAY